MGERAARWRASSEAKVMSRERLESLVADTINFVYDNNLSIPKGQTMIRCYEVSDRGRTLLVGVQVEERDGEDYCDVMLIRPR